MVSQAPGTASNVVTGSGIVDALAALLNPAAQNQIALQGQLGFTDPTTLGLGGDEFLPTLSREQFMAQLDQFNQLFQMEQQRFGLEVANANFTQRLAASQQGLQALSLLSSLSGPQDFVRHNFVINNLVPPEGRTVNPLQSFDDLSQPFVPGPVASPQFTPQPAPVAGGGGAADVIDSSFVPEPAPPRTTAPTQQQVLAGPTLESGDIGNEGLARNAQALQQADLVDVSNPRNVDFLKAFGLSFGDGGSTTSRVLETGDDPTGRGRENNELIANPTGAPLIVFPLDGREAPAGTPRAGDGGVFNVGTTDVPNEQLPFVRKLTGGLERGAFGERGEDLGPFGRQPFSFTNFLRLLPSEQAMTQGLIETPRAQGGLGSFFPDELERSRRAAFTGLSFGPSSFAA